MSIPTKDRLPATVGTAGSLFNQLFDYAGLYPPASLPLPLAVQTYRSHRSSELSWMLGPFVVHATLIEQLLKLSSPEDTPPLSVLVANGCNAADYFPILRQHLLLCLQTGSGLAGPNGPNVVALETAVPREVIASERPENFLGRLCDELDAFDHKANCAFVEMPLNVEPTVLTAWAEAVAGINTRKTFRFALKARLGGLNEDDVPAPERISAFLRACCQATCPFKVTAGLHHPVRGQGMTGRLPMHGFLNVFGAAALLYGGALPHDRINEMLADTDADSFVLGASEFSWKGCSVSTAALDEARRKFALSIGSCSFDEPVADLQALGFLPSF